MSSAQDLHDWAQAHLPPLLIKSGPKRVLVWQMLALPLALVVGYFLGLWLGLLCEALLVRTTRLGKARLLQLRGPMSLFLSVACAYVLVRQLELPPGAQALIVRATEAVAIAAVFWGLWRSVDISLATAAKSAEHADNRGILQLGVRFARLVLVATAVVTILQTLGYHVTALIAGLGIGGLAVALSAQKTLEHLLGSVMLSLDQPFQVGDTIKVDDVVADVESIGLRSTRLRTLDHTLVTFPNGRLADMRIENFTKRDQTRLRAILSLAPSASGEALTKVLQLMRARIASDEKIAPDSIVALQEVTPTALHIEVIVCFKTQRYSDFVTLREQLLLDILRIVEEAEARWALPTSVVLQEGV